MDKTTQQDKSKGNNPTGKGGFGDHPEHQSPGGWDKNNSFSYWLNYFKSLTYEEFKNYKESKDRDKEPMTMSAIGAYARVAKMIEELREFEVVANRTEGYPKESLKIDPEGLPIALVEFIGKKDASQNKVP